MGIGSTEVTCARRGRVDAVRHFGATESGFREMRCATINGLAIHKGAV